MTEHYENFLSLTHELLLPLFNEFAFRVSTASADASAVFFVTDDESVVEE